MNSAPAMRSTRYMPSRPLESAPLAPALSPEGREGKETFSLSVQGRAAPEPISCSTQWKSNQRKLAT